MYDTGDFIDDYAVEAQLRNDHSFLFRVTVADKKVATVQLVLVVIKNMQVNVAQREEAKAILKRIQQLSGEFGTKIGDDGLINV